jgi:hypothetical protein
MTATAKQKAVLAEIGGSHVKLGDYFGRRAVKAENVERLLAALKQHTKPVRPVDLGVIGCDHFFARMEAAGGDPKTFTYKKMLGDTDGLPHVVEFAFGVHREGLANRDDSARRKIVTGVNWSAALRNPFRAIGRGGESLDSLLADVRANPGQPVIAILHLACPRVEYADRGKSQIIVTGNANG